MPRINNPVSPIVSKLEGLHLFHFDGAPCAQRVRFALGEKGLKRGREVRFDASDPASSKGEPGRWVSRKVSLVKKHHMTETYAQIHPDMVVPALVHDGSLYLESMDIIEYLDSVFPGPQLIPQNSAQHEQVLALVEEAKVLHLSIRYVTFHWGLGRLAMLSAKERDKLNELAAAGSDGENLVSFYAAYSTRTIAMEVFEDHLARLYRAFERLDGEMKDGRKYLAGDEFSIADIFWSMKVLRLLETGYPLAEQHPLLARWYEGVRSRPAFQHEVMENNRLSNRLFTLKSGIENLAGIGLKSAIHKLALA